MACAAVDRMDGTIAAVLHPDTVAVGWLPVLRALKRIEPTAYAALLDVVRRMAAPAPKGENAGSSAEIIAEELARSSGGEDD